MVDGVRAFLVCLIYFSCSVRSREGSINYYLTEVKMLIRRAARSLLLLNLESNLTHI